MVKRGGLPSPALLSGDCCDGPKEHERPFVGACPLSSIRDFAVNNQVVQLAADVVQTFHDGGLFLGASVAQLDQGRVYKAPQFLLDRFEVIGHTRGRR
jgi:hypothetical protein